MSLFTEYTYHIASKRKMWKTEVESFRESMPQLKKSVAFFLEGEGWWKKRYLLSYSTLTFWKHYVCMTRTSWGCEPWTPSSLSTKRFDFFLTTQCLTILSANALNISFAFQFSTNPKHRKPSIWACDQQKIARITTFQKPRKVMF